MNTLPRLLGFSQEELADQIVARRTFLHRISHFSGNFGEIFQPICHDSSHFPASPLPQLSTEGCSLEKADLDRLFCGRFVV